MTIAYVGSTLESMSAIYNHYKSSNGLKSQLPCIPDVEHAGCQMIQLTNDSAGRELISHPGFGATFYDK